MLSFSIHLVKPELQGRSVGGKVAAQRFCIYICFHLHHTHIGRYRKGSVTRLLLRGERFSEPQQLS